jgi:selenocysteine lyase/cysteine desulfurase
VAVLPQTHWADGGHLELEVISGILQKSGCALVLDVTQSLGVVGLDVQTIQPDFLICASYKWLLGPYSFGFLYADPRYHQDGTPLEQGWVNRPGADNFSRLIDYTDTLNHDATRFDVGERSNMHLLPIAIAGLQQIHAWGQKNIAASLEDYTDSLYASLAELGFSSCDKAYRSPHFLGVKHRKSLPDNLLPQLADEGIIISQRGDHLRISPHLYCHQEDANQLCAALSRLLG